MTRARRIDTTQREIVAGLRGLGWRVWVIGGDIDLAVLVGQDVYLVDAKTVHGRKYRTTERQADMVADGWPIIFGTTAQDVADAIAARRQ